MTKRETREALNIAINKAQDSRVGIVQRYGGWSDEALQLDSVIENMMNLYKQLKR